MGQWRAVKAKVLLRALKRAGWVIIRQKGSHRTLAYQNKQHITFAFHDGEEIGPKMLARYAKHAGLSPEDI